MMETKCADVAQLAEQLICNQQVIGSSPIIGFMDGFPSGQRGQTVNLLQIASVVRIHLHPFALMSSMEQCLARKSMQSSITQCVRWCGGIGRRKGLKIPRGQLRAGSSPATSINLRVGETLILQRFSYF